MSEAARVKAIETFYKGYHFRSRLEARWAVFFETLRPRGLTWEYEPEGFTLCDGTRYLPDFRVRYPDAGQLKWFEVKPHLSLVTPEEWRKMSLFEDDLFILDGAPDWKMYNRLREVLFHEVDAWDVQGPFTPINPQPSKSAMADRRAGWAVWHYKGRPWWDEHDNFFDDWNIDTVDDLNLAIQSALSARFESGARVRAA